MNLTNKAKLYSYIARKQLLEARGPYNLKICNKLQRKIRKYENK